MEILHLTVQPEGSPSAKLTAYLPERLDEQTRPAIVICPGGGYRFVSPREAEPVALKFVTQGFAAFVLDYAVAPVRYPHALRQLAEAVALVRAHTAEWGLTPQRLIVAGFSAGGHLAASLACMAADPVLTEAGYQPAISRPDGLLLCYPVITSGPLAHRDSFNNLLGEGVEASAQSLEKRVSAQNPPTFIWTTADDGAVPAANTLMFASALQAAKVPYELHVFPHGHHGLSLATPQVNGGVAGAEATVAVWPDLFNTWVQQSWLKN
ncbi:alpha/beta hydrolase [Lacticaseibacillus sp. GG6-2]